MKERNDLAKNRYDFKWAHPGIRIEHAHSMEGMDVLSNAIKGMSEEEVNQKRCNELGSAMFDMYAQTEAETWAKWRQETTLREYYTEHGCPEEPDAPPVRILAATPNDVKEGEHLPVLFVIDGGGMTFNGMPEPALGSWYKAALNCGTRVVMVSLQYRLAPHNKYPKGVNDCHAVYQWIIEHEDELHIDPDKIVVAGASSGGHLTLSLGFRLKGYQYHGHMPRGLIVNVPAMDDVAYTDAFLYSFENEEGSHCGWDYVMAQDSWRQYLGERFGDPTLPPEAVPNRATLEDVQGFPPVWFPVVAEFDPGRDSVYKIASLLYQAGVFCDLHVWGGTSHMVQVGQPDGSDGDVIRRIWETVYGSVRDAITFDFRRSWI